MTALAHSITCLDSCNLFFLVFLMQGGGSEDVEEERSRVGEGEAGTRDADGRGNGCPTTAYALWLLHALYFQSSSAKAIALWIERSCVGS